ncbi:hypothetical protein Klosneuvirus_1_13 [Klosneuvirus KNV1]|uniref:Uncharacterized protein n=1 Tax=Klosneuvirus KNV1 TaxID=1977640 RepID=A0A1V0SHF2_9VIRU|nr:hypothetical protein Klosneuvirus_1_13 [Klosneuvirus KNV1]
MSSSKKIISFYKEVVDYYNKLTEEMSQKIDLKQNYNFNFVEEANKHIVEIYIDKKLKLKAEYNIVGLYNIPLSVWYWSWNIAFLNKTLFKELDKIKKFAESLDKNYNNFDSKEVEELHYLLANDNYYISSGNIERLIKIILYITKGLWIFPINHSDKKSAEYLDRVEYILITKILQIN